MTKKSYKILGKTITNAFVERTGGLIFTSGPTIETLMKDMDRLYKEDGMGSVANFVMEGIEDDDIAKFDGARDYLIETMRVSKNDDPSVRKYFQMAIKLTGLGHMDMFIHFNKSQTLLLDGLFNKYSITEHQDVQELLFDAENPSPRPILTRDGIKSFLAEHNIDYTEQELDEFIELAKFEDSEFGKDKIGQIEFYHNIHSHYVFSEDHNTSLLRKICNSAYGGSEDKEKREAMKRCVDRTVKILEVADRLNVIVNVDAEQTYIQKTLDSLTRQMQTKFHRDREAFIMNGYQSYLKATPEHIKLEIERCRRADIAFGLKIVRGAYMNEERRLASKKNYESPIWETIEDTHESYNLNIKNCMNNLDPIKDKILVASHNVDSCNIAKALMKQNNLDSSSVCFGQLKGFSDSLTYSLKDQGYNVIKYLPYGPTNYLIPYLLRRGHESKEVMREHLFLDDISDEIRARLHLRKKPRPA
eukprot:CAMPEP_0196995378 /NCGR_PEP_ID=MMETSP1380-20130617/1503_1 /TAXON_ID=5936 /ORGANISM="Euplotes crassus, Strain CT5" /LENGTH=473 /DNA_ID=CAMNT_0042411035 /DNA_START=106 /DNA_END=1527 /DNA_ORIENTATION=+